MAGNTTGDARSTPGNSDDRVLGDLDATTKMLSERARVVAGGIVLVWWSANWGEPPKGALGKFVADQLLGPAVACLLSLILDFLQYLFGFLSTHKQYANTANAGGGTWLGPLSRLPNRAFFELTNLNVPNIVRAATEVKGVLYCCRVAAFWVKILAVTVGVVWLVVLVFTFVLR